MTPSLIVLSGKARAGKGCIAKILVEEYGFVELSFAADLKVMAQKYYGVPEAELTVKKSSVSRQIMQGIGNMMRGEVDPLYWVKRVDYHTRRLNRPIVVSDGRFLNEFKWCRQKGGLLWKVVRENQPDVEFGANDPSETEQDGWGDWDAVIHNPNAPDWGDRISTQVYGLIKQGNG
jgi:hypothetical protein